MLIHPSTVISPSARIADDVRIGPFCVIEDHAELGSGCQLASGVVIKQGTRIGANNRIDVGAVMGAAPQHLSAGEDVGGIEIGDHNEIREYVTVHRAFQPDATTRIGNHNMLMAQCHVGHDSVVGDRNILANNVMLAGHVEMGDRNYIGGGAAFHQFCRIGSYTMVGGLAQIKRDVPPYAMVDGTTGAMVGLNQVGLRRAGFTREHRSELKAAYRLAFRSELSQDERIARLRVEFPNAPADQFWKFLMGGTRGFLQDRRIGKSNPARNSASTASNPNPIQQSESNEPRIIPFRRAA